MPITFDEANDLWELTDATSAEKESLTKIAIEEITSFFGGEIANKIVNQAKVFAEQQVGKKEEIPVTQDTFTTGEVGNA